MTFTRHQRTATAMLLAALLALFAASIATSTSAQAAPSANVSAIMSWAVSNNVNTAGSLTPSRAAVAPATEDEGGWTFPEGTGSYDDTTGELHLEFDGALEAGNEFRGNYGVQFSNLRIDVNADAEGVVSADVAHRGPGSLVWDEPTEGVTLVTFDATSGETDGQTTTWTVTPNTENVTAGPAFPGAQQFSQDLTDVLPPAFWGHFQQTSSDGPNAPANADKLPSPLSFAVSEGSPPSTSSTTSTTVAATTPPTTVPSPVGPPTGEAVEATSGHLEWGIKSSFITYLSSLGADGSVSTSGGATQNADDNFVFPLASGSEYFSSEQFSAPFSGDVHLAGHEGVLDVNLTNPRVIINGNSGELIMDATSKAIETGIVEELDDLTIASLDLSDVQATSDGDEVTIANMQATLTEEAAPIFAGYYTAGERLDPATVVLEVQTAEDLPGAVTPMITCVADTVTAGGQVQLCADGFLPGEQVQAFIHSDPKQIGITVADAAGAVDDTFTVPADTEPGIHHFELRGVTSGVSIMSGPVTVLAGGGPSAGLDALPRTGSNALAPILVGLVMLGAGLVLTAASRRRDTPSA